jgi:cobalt/nickel transport system permease protein
VAEPPAGWLEVTELPLPEPPKTGWLASRDPRLRIIAASLFALVVVSLGHLAAVLAALAVAAALAIDSGLAGWNLCRRLFTLEAFMFVLVLSLPFTVAGEAVLEFGPLAASQEGLALALMILLKANAVVLALLALVGSLEPVVFGHALARLGVPEKLVHLLLFSVRHVHLLHQEYLRLRQAVRARAFVPRSDRHTWNTYGWLMGMLLVRSMARSQRVLAAMRCRGFRGRLYLLDSPIWRRADSGLALGLALLLGMLLVVDRLA